MRQTLSLVLSATALVVATLGSTPLGEAARSAAAQVLPRNSVGPLQLKRNAVTARKLSPNAVRTSHVLDGSLLAVDFKTGQLPKGDKGDRGEKGDRGDRGESGATRVTVRTSAPSVVSPGAASTSSASCAAGERVTGGGVNSNTLGGSVARSHPSGSNWVGSIRNDGAAATVLTVYVVCAAP
jgi:hypothetical protein